MKKNKEHFSDRTFTRIKNNYQEINFVKNM